MDRQAKGDHRQGRTIRAVLACIAADTAGMLARAYIHRQIKEEKT